MTKSCSFDSDDTVTSYSPRCHFFACYPICASKNDLQLNYTKSIYMYKETFLLQISQKSLLEYGEYLIKAENLTLTCHYRRKLNYKDGQKSNTWSNNLH